ncbi:HEAT repeat domain-containing protein (plasmid) [Hymenobacter tibetensis]|uniref:HEAT repeat domain-containing protein n=1 Tax=Hymenobacter tibetensis TaxID=497967 RepID=A0ABY4D4D6_9BACT|nr:HEAT repeat domain-containing protein [Hymenobacter tibetensis]UOG77389.1 HEAT repeat domain-containing protein [Hymenobacter tibetensis]
MSDLKKLLETYEDTSSDRVQIIRELEFVEDEGKWPFLINIMINESADDLERIEVLRIIEVTEPPQIYVNRVISNIYNIIIKEGDCNLRNYAVIALKNFKDEKLLNLAKDILLNEDEDLDMRWNAFDALKNLKCGNLFNEIVEKLRNDKEFGKAIGCRLIIK